MTDNALQVNELFEKFNPGIESMEGAALHYVCLLQKVSFLQLRSISNMVGERDKSKWAMKEAINNLNENKNFIDKFYVNMVYTLGFSPCPNDTFIFHAL